MVSLEEIKFFCIARFTLCYYVRNTPSASWNLIFWPAWLPCPGPGAWTPRRTCSCSSTQPAKLKYAACFIGSSLILKGQFTNFLKLQSRFGWVSRYLKYRSRVKCKCRVQYLNHEQFLSEFKFWILVKPRIFLNNVDRKYTGQVVCTFVRETSLLRSSYKVTRMSSGYNSETLSFPDATLQ